jgi:hypothetical protein
MNPNGSPDWRYVIPDGELCVPSVPVDAFGITYKIFPLRGRPFGYIYITVDY